MFVFTFQGIKTFSTIKHDKADKIDCNQLQFYKIILKLSNTAKHTVTSATEI